jgi:hypothetical protein
MRRGLILGDGSGCGYRTPLGRAQRYRKVFSTDGALDRPWMHIETELFQDQSRQLTCPDRFARHELCPEKCQYLPNHLPRRITSAGQVEAVMRIILNRRAGLHRRIERAVVQLPTERNARFTVI